jgi:aldehyde:ferredoxin oxidoreductase
MECHMLKIDLTNRSYEIDTIPNKIINHYIGGRGLGAYLLYKLVPPQIDPLSADNHLIFTAGPANGTDLFFSPKTILTTKSPLTNIYLYTLGGGIFSNQIRKAGFWAIDIKGMADRPVYLIINNKGVEFRDATSLWGMKTGETQRAMVGTTPLEKSGTIAIGPAGERLIKYASILTGGQLYRTLGRGGGGCVMGSKKLKGVVISGNLKIKPADDDKFDYVKKAMVNKVREKKEFAEWWRSYGTAGDINKLDALGMLPTRNWRGGQFESMEKICSQTNAQMWPRENRSCAPYCVAPCSHYIEINDGPYKGARCDGPDYETVYAFGSCCGIDKFDAIVAANQICDESGIDTMSAGVSIAFAMECFEKGLLGLKDTDGIELRFGSDSAMIAVLNKIVNLEGIGKRLAEGTKRLSQEIGGSEAFAMHAKGLELGGYECRGLMGQGLAYAIGSRGGCHHAYGNPARVEAFDGTRMKIEGKGEQVKNIAIDQIIRDCVPVCAFVRWIIDFETVSNIVSALFGEVYSISDLKDIGTRIINTERLFNMREGLTRKNDSLPTRLLNEPKLDGPTKGATVPLEELKDDYYRAMGWNLETGNPSDSVLEELEKE